jgi:hypothetical protein
MRVAARLSVAAFVIGSLLSASQRPIAGAAKWDPIDPRELAETTPKVEKDADAEVLLWSVRVQDQTMGGYFSQSTFFHHLRIKIFTDRGRETYSRIDLPHGGTVHIKDVEARSIRRDGTFTEIGKADVFERTLAKAGGIKVDTTSFALPAIETGGIVEYRWTEIDDYANSNFLRMLFNRDLPVRLVRYQFVPLRIPGLALQGMPFQTDPLPTLSEEKGYAVVTLANIPARREEPQSPPIWETEPWMLIYYGSVDKVDVEKYWLGAGKALYDEAHEYMSPNSAIRRAVEPLASRAGSLDEKLASLVALCRSTFKRVDLDTSTDADRKAFKFNRFAGAAFNAGSGTASSALGVFIAMAQAAGLDARLASVASRNDIAFDRSMKLRQFLSRRVAAIRDGAGWRFVDLANDHAPGGHLGWAQEMVPALIGDKDAQVWETTPGSAPEWSLRSRTATLRLSEDGTLEGDVAIETGGHPAMALEEQHDHLAPAERDTAVKDALTARLPGAEITGIAVERETESGKPFTTRYHLKVPGYAQRTGSRLFIQPALFQKAVPPVFAPAVRRRPIFFDYAWKEVDRVRIELPAGYQLESGDAPAPVAMAPAGTYSMTLSTTPEGRVVEMTREFVMGAGQRLQFPVGAYGSVKQFFDYVAKADGHTLTLRKSGGDTTPR